MPAAAASERLKKLQFRASRRGFVEADLILGGYAAARLPGMSADDLDAFEAFLDLPDQDLYEWIMRLRPMPGGTPESVTRLVSDIQGTLPAHAPSPA